MREPSAGGRESVHRADSSTYVRNAFRLNAILLALLAAALPVYLYLCLRFRAWQLYALLVISGGAGIALLAGALLARRGQPVLAIWMVIGTITLARPAITAVIAGLGIALSVLGVLITVAIAGQSLPPKQAGRAIAVGLFSSFAVSLLDRFGATYRLSVPELQTFIPIVGSVGVLIFGYFALRQFQNYALRIKIVILFLCVAIVTAAGMEAVFALNLRSITRETGEVSAPMGQLIKDTELAFGAMVLLSGLGALFIAQFFTRPILTLTEAAEEMSGGDLAVEAPITSGDEVGTLSRTFNEMVSRIRETVSSEQERRAQLEMTVQRYVGYMAELGRGNLSVRLEPGDDMQSHDDPLLILGRQLNETAASLRAMIVRIRDAANALNSQGTEILAAASQQAAGATQQASAISQTTTSIDEVKTIAVQSVSRAQQVVEVAQRTVDVSYTGRHAVQDTIDSMARIKTRVEDIAENILALSEQTQQIGEIIDAVNDIASQSNMLALNAAVEAARAGEHGKGFSVVAGEVRDLAERSRQATAQAKTILSEIQRATNATVMATEEGTKDVDDGTQLAAQAWEAIARLAQVIDESAQMAMQMSAGGQQQATGVEQIAVAMENINQATMQSLSSTQQMKQSAQELNDLARSLTEIVEQYQG